MNIRRLFQPQPTLSEQEVARGLRWLTWEGTASQGFYSITTSGFLAAFALVLGANNLQIGILAAIPFIMQVIQLPLVWFVEKYRRRKVIAVGSWLAAQLLWFAVVPIPILMDVPSSGAISLLLWLMAARALLSAVCTSAWNGWIRDLVPQGILGRFFSRRLAFGTVAGVIFGLGGAFFVDYWQRVAPSGSAVFGYSYVFLFGALFLGLASPVFMSLVPEPLMQVIPGPQPPIRDRLVAPLRDDNFRRLMQFLFFWGFASNLAVPFFAVYMLQRLGLPLTWVIAFSILSQLSNLLFLRIWGNFADRFGSKAVLSLCASLYLLVILGWTFTAMPDRYFLTVPILVVLHVFAGIASAGVILTLGTIGLKLTPQGESTSYLAGASLATNIGAGLGPLLGGFLADFFSTRQLSLTFMWSDPVRSIQLPALSLVGRDFLFGIAFLLGLITLGILVTVREEGELSREAVLESLMAPMREFSRPMSSVPALNVLGNFPFGFLKKVPIPGLDVAMGVTAYEIAEMARVATAAAVRGRRVTTRITRTLQDGLSIVWKDREKAKEYGVELTRQVTRGALHAIGDKPLDMEQVADQVMRGVVKVSGQAGVAPEDAILGSSQGIVQGAAEIEADLGAATLAAVETAKEVAAEAGLSEEVAVAKAVEGALEVAEALGPQAVAEVAESLPDELLPLDTKEGEDDN